MHVREYSHFPRNNLSVLSETWNFHTLLAFQKIYACLPTSSQSLSENWVYFLFLERSFSVSVALSLLIARIGTSSTLESFASCLKYKIDRQFPNWQLFAKKDILCCKKRINIHSLSPILQIVEVTLCIQSSFREKRKQSKNCRIIYITSW